MAEEIFVVDSGSTTTPLRSAAIYPACYSHDWPGFGIQKNRALDMRAKTGACPGMQMNG